MATTEDRSVGKVGIWLAVAPVMAWVLSAFLQIPSGGG